MRIAVVVEKPLKPLSSPQPQSVRATTAEQFEAVLRVHADLMGSCSPTVDADAAKRRIRAGQVGYDALRVLRSCGDLLPRFLLVLDAFEVAGFISNEERRSLLEGEPDVDELVSGWFTGDRTPRDPRKRVTRQAAIVVGNALLRAASAHLCPVSTWRTWVRTVCPCCGGAPDIVLVERPSVRTLVCARCDTRWRARRLGCLGCDSSEMPAAVARISNPELGYDLMMCNACGRFIKERPRRGLESLIVERGLTMELDLAAEQRGLRI